MVSRALVVATGVSAQGRREILGMALGDAETTDFWTSFLRSLRERGLKVPSPHDPEGVVLVTSDAHAGIRAAVRAILPGAAWQRCRVHFARTITSRLGSAHTRARGRPGLHDLRPDHARGRRRPVPARHRHFEGRLPFRIAQMLKDAEPDLTAFAALPREHWTKIWSNNPIERLNREIKRRADVVQVFPDSESVTRLIGSVLPEQRGVAVRRTPIPLPDLTATPDRHAPHRQQHRRRQQSPRPARHHHLTGRTPHQET